MANINNITNDNNYAHIRLRHDGEVFMAEVADFNQPTLKSILECKDPDKPKEGHEARSVAIASLVCGRQISAECFVGCGNNLPSVPRRPLYSGQPICERKRTTRNYAIARNQKIDEATSAQRGYIMSPHNHHLDLMLAAQYNVPVAGQVPRVEDDADQLRGTIQALQQQRATLVTERDAARADLQAQNQTSVADLKTEITQLRDNIKGLETQNAVMKGERDSALEDFAKVRDAAPTAELQMEIAEMKAARDAAEAKYERVRTGLDGFICSSPAFDDLGDLDREEVVDDVLNGRTPRKALFQ